MRDLQTQAFYGTSLIVAPGQPAYAADKILEVYDRLRASFGPMLSVVFDIEIYLTTVHIHLPTDLPPPCDYEAKVCQMSESSI